MFKNFFFIFILSYKKKTEENKYNYPFELMSTSGSKKLNKLDHTVPIYSPRTTYKFILQNDENLLADLTLNFDPFTINVLKNEFFIRNWEMQITEFILVVKEHLLSW